MNECPVCHKPLPKMPPSQTRKYCSRTCAGIAKQTLPKTKICQVCGREWIPENHFQASGNKTCSRKCAGLLSSKERKDKALGLRAPRITLNCQTCGKSVVRRAAALKRSATVFCSCRCNGIERAKELVKHSHKGRAAWTEASLMSYRNKMSGPNNPAWKGGVTYFKTHGNYQGIKYVRCPAEYATMARKDGYVMEHRLIVAMQLNRPLKRTEVVHHKDHNPRNNSPDNLQLFPSNQAHKSAEGVESR